MTDKVLQWLDTCSLTPEVTLDSLGPGMATGLYYKGVAALEEDIVGNKKPHFTYIVRHRGSTGENWAARFCDWVLLCGSETFFVTPKRGGQCATTRDGFSTWEVELTVTQQS